MGEGEGKVWQSAGHREGWGKDLLSMTKEVCGV